MNEALVFLVLLWAALLVPSALRSRTGSPHVTVGGFERAMDVLRSPASRSTGRELLVPGDAGRIVDHVGIDPAEEPRPYRREDPRVQARRTWFLRLLAGTVLSVGLAIVIGGALLWAVAVLSVAATATYVTLLRRWKVQADQVRTVVRKLESDAAPHRVPVGAAVGESSVRLRRWDG